MKFTQNNSVRWGWTRWCGSVCMAVLLATQGVAGAPSPLRSDPSAGRILSPSEAAWLREMFGLLRRAELLTEAEYRWFTGDPRTQVQGARPKIPNDRLVKILKYLLDNRIITSTQAGSIADMFARG